MSQVGVMSILKKKFRNENLVAIGAIIVIIFISSSTQYEIFYPWLSYYGTSEILKYLIPYNIMLVLLYANYFITMFMNPGYVPEDFNSAIKEQKKLAKLEKKREKKGKRNEREEEDNIPLNQLRNRKFIGNQLKGYTPLKCDKCKGYKPARTHHCSICQRCVLRMDHHCPWVANCVGYNNVAYFGRFLGYVTFLCLYNLILIGIRILNVIDYQNNRKITYSYVNYDDESDAMTGKPYPLINKREMIFIVIDLIMLFVVIFLVSPLFAFQVMYATSNTSTIEDRENKKIQVLIEKGEVPNIKYPYDYGWLENLKDVYGRNILNWLFTGRGLGDGIHFNIKGNIEPNERQEYLIYWPPKEYYQYKRMKKEDLEDQLDQQKKHGTRNFDGRVSRHVRRDSEGYVVKTTTEQDRERMVMKAIKREEEREKRKQQRLLKQQFQERDDNDQNPSTNYTNYESTPITPLNPTSTNQPYVSSFPSNRKVMSMAQALQEYSDDTTTGEDDESSGTETASYSSDFEYDSEYDVNSEYEYDQQQYMNEVYVPPQVHEVDTSDLWSDEAEMMNQGFEEEENLILSSTKDKNV